jgi:hypothetical protein
MSPASVAEQLGLFQRSKGADNGLIRTISIFMEGLAFKLWLEVAPGDKEPGSR